MEGNDTYKLGWWFPLGFREENKIRKDDINSICNVLIFRTSNGHAGVCYTSDPFYMPEIRVIRNSVLR